MDIRHGWHGQSLVNTHCTAAIEDLLHKTKHRVLCCVNSLAPACMCGWCWCSTMYAVKMDGISPMHHRGYTALFRGCAMQQFTTTGMSFESSSTQKQNHEYSAKVFWRLIDGIYNKKSVRLFCDDQHTASCFELKLCHSCSFCCWLYVFGCSHTLFNFVCLFLGEVRLTPHDLPAYVISVSKTPFPVIIRLQ